MADSAHKTSAREVARHGRTTTRRHQVPLPPQTWRDETLPLLLERHGAFGCQFGRKRKRGRWLRELAITFFTSHKRDLPARGRGGVKPIPEWIAWKDGGAVHRLRTDVIEMPNGVEKQRDVWFGPGDAADAGGGSVATIGAVLRRRDRPGILLTTAGHLLGHRRGEGQSLSIVSGAHTLKSRVLLSVERAQLDYALLEPVDDEACANRYQDFLRIGPVYNAIPSDSNTRVYVACHRLGKLIQTTVRGVNAQIDFAGESFRGVITTARVTDRGDSGAALIDDANRLWGFLIGAVGDFSIFVPAQLVLDQAGADLLG